MAKRIDGKAIAAQIKQELKEQVQQLAKDNITVTLAVIQVGQDPASCVYVRNKQRTCEELGIHSLSYELEETTSEEKLLFPDSGIERPGGRGRHFGAASPARTYQ